MELQDETTKQAISQVGFILEFVQCIECYNPLRVTKKNLKVILISL